MPFSNHIKTSQKTLNLHDCAFCVNAFTYDSVFHTTKLGSKVTSVSHMRGNVFHSQQYEHSNMKTLMFRCSKCSHRDRLFVFSHMSLYAGPHNKLFFCNSADLNSATFNN